MSSEVSSRRKFLAGATALAATSVTSSAASGNARVVNMPKRKPLAASIANKGASVNTITPPFAVRVLHRMAYGPRRVQRLTTGGGGTDPEFVFASGFETPSSDFAGIDDIAHFNALGNTDDERLENYVDEQLNRDLPDPELDARFAEHPSAWTTLNRSLTYLFSRYECADFNTYDRPRREAEAAAFLRATYSRKQLLEMMVDFWHNHFNVFATLDRDTQATWSDWDRLFRSRAFGNFYNMLEATAKHTAMLRYLDNYQNSAGGFNENYARELFELHTMGAENYAGTVFQDHPSVGVLPENPYIAINDPDLARYTEPGRMIQAKYVDDDVYEAARALTGWRYEDLGGASPPNCGSGLFFADDGDHDNASKSVLSSGTNLISSDGNAEFDGRVVLKLAAYHPGTATYIARKLCRRFISDDPPESIVTAAANTFFALRNSPNQIGETLRVILTSDEFKDPGLWGQKIKRPFEYVVGAMRAAGCDHTWRVDNSGNFGSSSDDDSTTGTLLSRFAGTGQRLYNWRTPDGYPDRRDHWQGSQSLVQCWRTIDYLVDRDWDEDPNRVMRIVDITLSSTPANPTPRWLVEFWCDFICGFTPSGGWTGPVGSLYTNANTTLGRAALQFMTQQGFAGENDASVWPSDEPIARADLRNNDGPADWSERLRGLVSLILWSPQFMQR